MVAKSAAAATKKNYMEMFQKDEKNLKCSEITSKGRIFTGSPSLDWSLSGGLYQGYTTCFYGPEGGGKSFLTMLAQGALHRFDPDAMSAVVSTEFRPPVPSRVAKLGVDPTRLMIREANTTHDVFDWIASDESSFENSDGTKGAPGLLWMLKDGAPIKSLVIDSIKGIQGPREQKMESTEDDVYADLSRILNPALRKILPIIRKYNLMTIFVQQVNENQNADEVKYQNIKWKIPSGQAVKHFCETMALVERVNNKESKLFNESMTQGSSRSKDIPVQDGHTIRVRVEKANLDSPFREAELQVMYSKGLVNTGLEVAKLAAGVGVISHPLNDKNQPITAQWVIDSDDVKQKWIGFDNMVDDLESKPELQRAIMALVLKKTG